jgi:excisionase family DNA binding protein
MSKKPNATQTPRLLTLKGASEYLGLTIWSLRTRIWAGEIPIVRFQGGRKIFIDRQDLEDFIQRNKETYT